MRVVIASGPGAYLYTDFDPPGLGALRLPHSRAMSARRQIEEIMAERGVFTARRHPELRRTAERMAREGVLRQLLPGVLCRWQDAAIPEIRLRAAAAWVPNGVLTGVGAARLTFWPELAVPTVTVASQTLRGSRRASRSRVKPSIRSW